MPEEGHPVDALQDDPAPALDLDDFERGRGWDAGGVDGAGRRAFLLRPRARDPAVEQLQHPAVTPGVDVRAKALPDEGGGFQRWFWHDILAWDLSSVPQPGG